MHTIILVIGWIMFSMGFFAFIGGKRLSGGIVAAIGLVIVNIF